MAKYALVKQSDNIVTNIVEWDGTERQAELVNGDVVFVGWSAPSGYIAVASDTAIIGQTYIPAENRFE